MKRYRARTIRACMMIVAAMSLAACAASQPVPGPSPSVLRAGVCPNAPPVIFKNNDGFRTGFEAELARALADSLGRRLYFVECSWDELIPELLAGRIDIIMSGMTITASRSVRVAFSDPYMRSGQLGLTTNAHALAFNSLNALLGSRTRMGVEAGTTGEIIAQQYCAAASKVMYANPERGVKALLRGRIDVFLHDAPVVWWYASQYESRGLTALPYFVSEEDIAWAVRKDDTALLDGANRFLAGWKEDGRLKTLLRRWLPSML